MYYKNLVNLSTVNIESFYDPEKLWGINVPELIGLTRVGTCDVKSYEALFTA